MNIKSFRNKKIDGISILGKNKSLLDKLQKVFDNVCKDKIDYDITKESDSNDTFLLSYTKTKQINAFAIIREFRRNRIYIHLICSTKKGMGAKMIKTIEKIAKKCRKYKVIEVHAIDEAINFYKRFGYIESSKPCEVKPRIKRRIYIDDELYRLTKCIV